MNSRGVNYSLTSSPASQICAQQVASANDIVEVIGSYFPLRQSGANFKALCPFHQEKTPSFIVSAHRQRFHCFGCGAGGDVFRFVMNYEHVDFRSALSKLAAHAALTSENATRPPIMRPAQRVDQLRPMRTLDFLERGSIDDLRRLAALRGFAREALEIPSAAGTLWFATIKGQRAWIVTDKMRFVLEARRLDGNVWQHIGRKKAWTLPGGNKKWPLGIFEARDSRAIALVEGSADFVAAYHLIWAEDRRDVAPVAMLGASITIHAAALPLFSKKRVRIFPHFDANRNGFEAAREWAMQLEGVGAVVDCFDLSDLTAFDGRPVCDLNDLLFVGPDELEEATLP
jgi:hypothetical protein